MSLAERALERLLTDTCDDLIVRVDMCVCVWMCTDVSLCAETEVETARAVVVEDGEEEEEEEPKTQETLLETLKLNERKEVR